MIPISRIAILVLCYIFFLTSRWTMKGILAGRDYRSTEIGVPFELSDDITVTILGWSWAEEQGLMEVELEIINVREDLNRDLAIESGYRENTDTSRMKPLESETVLEEGIYNAGDEVAVMVNGMGGTPLMELLVANKHVAEVLAEKENCYCCKCI